MSMYGDGRYNDDRNELYDEIRDFLKTHPIYELMEIISHVFLYSHELYSYGRVSEYDQ